MCMRHARLGALFMDYASTVAACVLLAGVGRLAVSGWQVYPRCAPQTAGDAVFVLDDDVIARRALLASTVE